MPMPTRAAWRSVLWDVAATLSVPLGIKLAMESTEYQFFASGVNHMCVWCRWGSLGNSDCYANWTALWRDIRAAGPVDDFAFFVGGTTVVHLGVFWTYCLALSVLDLWGPAWVVKYKVQEKHAATPLSPRKWWKGVRRVLFNNIVVTIPLTALAYGRFEGRLDMPLPSLSSALLQMTAFVFVEEILFYYSHRLLHHPRLYPHIHKIHHQFTHPVGFVALYAHPLEHALSNLLPAVAGALVIKSHCFLFWVWITLGICSTVNTHCGYHFPCFISPRAHDFHHEKFTEVYGVMGWLDTLHGTNAEFVASESAKHYKVYYTLRPPWVDAKQGKAA
ncbi:C-4 methylsterol oxidase [Aureococcus anophagefferens]|uniref:C-4 methylsterol oxidase n=2 Tax=Aureococcus anophagefferens TaxID=44056 RepID=A0ABR1GGF4_AURAN